MYYNGRQPVICGMVAGWRPHLCKIAAFKLVYFYFIDWFLCCHFKLFQRCINLHSTRSASKLIETSHCILFTLQPSPSSSWAPFPLKVKCDDVEINSRFNENELENRQTCDLLFEKWRANSLFDFQQKKLSQFCCLCILFKA